jgi:hypothetical protein
VGTAGDALVVVGAAVVVDAGDVVLLVVVRGEALLLAEWQPATTRATTASVATHRLG